MGHQHLVCSLHLAGPDRVAFLGDMVVIHATAVVAEVAQYHSNFLTATPLSQQISEGIYHFADTIGIVAKNLALGLKPFFTGLFIGPKSDISSEAELLYGVPEIEHFNIGVEAFGERPIALSPSAVTTSFRSGFWLSKWSNS